MPRALTALQPGRPLGARNKVLGALRKEMEERGLKISLMIEEVWNSNLTDAERAMFLLGIMRFTHPFAKEEDSNPINEDEKPIIIMSREDMIKLAKGSGG